MNNAMLYEQLFKGLHTHRIRYLVVGAVAVNLHGIPRMTADLDVMVDLEKENVHRFIEMIVPQQHGRADERVGFWAQNFVDFGNRFRAASARRTEIWYFRSIEKITDIQTHGKRLKPLRRGSSCVCS